MQHECDESRVVTFMIERAVGRAFQAYMNGRRQETQEESQAQQMMRKAAETIAQYSGVPTETILKYKGDFERAFREAKIRTHPDRPERGGSHDLFVTIQQAADILRKIHK